MSWFDFAFELRYDEEPNARIGHVRFCEGWAINWPWNEYCDTSILGNGKQTGNTKLFLTLRDTHLLDYHLNLNHQDSQITFWKGYIDNSKQARLEYLTEEEKILYFKIDLIKRRR
jgi:hypothetical protein